MKQIFRMRVGAWRVLSAAALLVVLLPAPGEALLPTQKTLRLNVPSGSGKTVKPRAEFRAETTGSPQPTIVGGWSEDAAATNQANLTFAGGNTFTTRTTFLGTWISPASTRSKKPKLVIDYDLNYVNTFGTEIPIVHGVRARFAGGKWGPWAKAKTPIAAAESTTGAGSLSVVVPLTEPRRVQFQWKITGAISGPALLHGDFRLNVG